MAAKNYAGGHKATRLVGSISNAATAFTIEDATGLPAVPFVLTLARGTSAEEKVLVTARSGANITAATRAFDGTTASSHSAVTVEHTIDAESLTEFSSHTFSDHFTAVEGDAAIAAHAAAADPHPTYLTAAEANALYLGLTQPYARVGLNGAITRSTTLALIAWDSDTDEDFDPQGFHSMGTNPQRLTVPAGMGGTYWAHAQLTRGTASSAPATATARIMKNNLNQVAKDIISWERTGQQLTMKLGGLVQLVAGDYCVVDFIDSASAGNIATVETHFSLQRISA